MLKANSSQAERKERNGKEKGRGKDDEGKEGGRKEKRRIRRGKEERAHSLQQLMGKTDALCIHLQTRPHSVRMSTSSNSNFLQLLSF